MPLEETWGAMAELVDQGLVRAIGLSNYVIADIETCHWARSVTRYGWPVASDHLRSVRSSPGAGILG